MSPICTQCPQKNSCKTLCKKNEEYTAQDHVRRREKLLHDLELGTQVGKWPSQVGTIETVLKLFFIDRKTPLEIADIVIKSKRYVNKIIQKYKPIIAENIKKSVPGRRI